MTVKNDVIYLLQNKSNKSGDIYKHHNSLYILR